MLPISIYLHVPFCKHRCSYCDFNTYAGLEHLIPKYSEAICAEIRSFSQHYSHKPKALSVYFGGGTPSLLPVDYLEKIISQLVSGFELSSETEITLEANPGGLGLEYFKAIKQLGINRLSIGVQSPQPEELALLERQHNFEDVISAMVNARAVGFDNISLDLMFGLPGQTLKGWQANLERVLALQPEHVSLYNLTIEADTRLGRLIKNQQLPEPDEDMAADMFEWTMAALKPYGYEHYEISNWAKKKDVGKSYRSEHNCQYWRSLPYIGFGAGAHSYISPYRFSNPDLPMRYIASVQSEKIQNHPFTHSTASKEKLDPKTEMLETMMMGLRLIHEGVSKNTFFNRFNQPMENVFGREIDDLIALGLLQWSADKVRLTLSKRGVMLANQVFLKLFKSID